MFALCRHYDFHLVFLFSFLCVCVFICINFNEHMRSWCASQILHDGIWNDRYINSKNKLKTEQSETMNLRREKMAFFSRLTLKNSTFLCFTFVAIHHGTTSFLSVSPDTLRLCDYKCHFLILPFPLIYFIEHEHQPFDIHFTIRMNKLYLTPATIQIKCVGVKWMEWLCDRCDHHRNTPSL